MKTITLSAQAELFIIPNSCRDKVDENGNFLYHQVQVWIPVFEGWYNKASENIIDHGLHMRDGSFIRVKGSVIDATPLIGKHEGDIVTLTLPGYIEDDEEDEKVNIKITVRLNQKSYRYRHFGTFDEVLKSMVA